MWKFFFTIVDLYVNDRGLIEEFIFQASVPLINYMQKNPDQFRNAVFDGFGSCMDMMFNLIGKIFHNAREKSARSRPYVLSLSSSRCLKASRGLKIHFKIS